MNMLELSKYDNFFSRVMAVFPREMVHVVDGENLIKRPFEEIIRVESFLQLNQFYKKEHFYVGPKGFPCFSVQGSTRCMFNDKGRKHPSITEAFSKKLHGLFGPNMRLFEEISSVNFEWLRSSYS